MAAVTDDPPADVAAEMQALNTALDQLVPAKELDRNLLVATWNIRAFGDLTEKWRSGQGDTPKRDLASLRCITAMLVRFDVIVVQEVRGNLKCLRQALKVLGPSWGMILTDVTQGPEGNDERLAFLFDTRRVTPSGLACELVLLDPRPGAAGAESTVRQFARTPYAVSFLSARETFILVTLHVRYGTSPADRIGELRAIAEWLADWARREHEWGHNLLALGDFNIDRQGDPLYDAFTSWSDPAGRAQRHTANDLRRGPGSLLRSNRLVHRKRWRPSAVAVLHRPRRRCRLRPACDDPAPEDRALLATFGSLPVVGGVRGAMSGTVVHQWRQTFAAFGRGDAP